MAIPSELERRIGAAIAADGPMPFWRFCELALYQAELGYYARPGARVGREGDFLTSPALDPVFGRTLSRLVPRVARAVGPAAPLRVVDAGAGEGQLLAALGSAATTVGLEPVVVERGPALRERARQRLTAAGLSPIVLAEASDLARLEPRCGLVVANELFDALPARRLRRTRRGLEEAHVALAGEGLVESWVAVPDEGGPVRLPLDRECCVARGTAALIAALAAGISRGLVLVIDYGYPARLLYALDGPGSPMRGFRAGRLVETLHHDPGAVDLTCHVDFTALARAAEACGLEILFFTDQSYLLLALGILEDPAVARARRLIHPEDMGGAFRCLALGKGIGRAAFDDLELRDRSRWLEG